MPKTGMSTIPLIGSIGSLVLGLFIKNKNKK